MVGAVGTVAKRAKKDKVRKFAVRLAAAAAGLIQTGTFEGWQARRVLSSPSGESYTVEEMRAAHWLQQLARP